MVESTIGNGPHYGRWKKGEQRSVSMLFVQTALDRVLPRKVSGEHGGIVNSRALAEYGGG